MLVCDAVLRSISDLAIEVALRLGRNGHVLPVPVGVVGTVLKAFGKNVDWTRLSAPFVIDTSNGLARVNWRPPFSVAEELDWSLQR